MTWDTPRHVFRSLPDSVWRWLWGWCGSAKSEPYSDDGQPTSSPESIAEFVQRARQELPPPVVPGTRTKTHGRWRDSTGKWGGSMKSGRDEHMGPAVDLLRECGIRRPPPELIATTED